MDALAQVSFTVMAILGQVASANDLSLTLLRCLAILRDREPRISDLAEHLGIDRSSVSGLLDRASDRGLARRIPSKEDGRSAQVALTAKGRRLGAALTTEVAARIELLVGDLSARERRDLAGLLDRILGPHPETS